VIPKLLAPSVAFVALSGLSVSCSSDSSHGAAPGGGTGAEGSLGGMGAGSGGSSSGSQTGSGGGTGGETTTATTLPCEVATFLREHCQSCHNSRPNHVAPMALERPEDFTARSVAAAEKTIAERVPDRVTATENPMPPDGRLSDAALAPLVDWISAGMPAGTCTEPGPEPPRPFETLSRDAALTKVKTFLTGLAPEEAEFAAYRQDPAALPGLIDTFLGGDAWKARELALFKLLFQQRTDGDDLGTYLKIGNNAQYARVQKKSALPFSDYIEQSFARTAQDLVERGRPFTETVTTRTFMLNVPLMALLAHMDARPANDLNQRAPSWLEKAYPNASVTYVKDRTIPWSDSIDPASPDFLHFSVSATPNGNLRLCGDALDQTYTGFRAFDQIWLSELGLPGNDFCWATSPVPTLFTPEDREFRPVTVRLARDGEDRTRFWDLAGLRKASELVLGVEYVGFLGSLGFLGTFTTNDSNEYRVRTTRTWTRRTPPRGRPATAVTARWTRCATSTGRATRTSARSERPSAATRASPGRRRSP
jgi:cytochrome c551/c552